MSSLTKFMVGFTLKKTGILKVFHESMDFNLTGINGDASKPLKEDYGK
jgi:hypothetical protein